MYFFKLTYKALPKKHLRVNRIKLDDFEKLLAGRCDHHSA